MASDIQKSIEVEKKNIASKLSDFTDNIDSSHIENYKGSHEFSISKEISFEKCRLLPYLLNNILNCKVYWFPIEKILWSCDFSYKGEYCTLSHRKFGFKLYVSDSLSDNKASLLAKDLVSDLRDALGVTEKVVDLKVESAIDSGDIIVHNKLRNLEERYSYFRDLSNEAGSEEDVPLEKLLDGIDKDANLANKTREINKIITKMNIAKDKREYYREVALIYFISLIEHICLLLHAFNHDGGKVTDLTMKNWSNKFEKVIGFPNEDIKKGFEYLRQVSLYKRNPVTHGFLTPKMTEASFYFEEIKHRLPINLFNKEVLDEYGKNINLANLDNLLKAIKESEQFRNPMKYLIETGSDIPFNNEYIKKLAIVVHLSEKELDDLIEREIWEQTNALNMDW